MTESETTVIDLSTILPFDNSQTASTIESEWDISYDGYYIFCKHCEYEPDPNMIYYYGGRVPSICPQCKANMKNYKKFGK